LGAADDAEIGAGEGECGILKDQQEHRRSVQEMRGCSRNFHPVIKSETTPTHLAAASVFGENPGVNDIKAA
jgi:hypothetical protein